MRCATIRAANALFLEVLTSTANGPIWCFAG